MKKLINDPLNVADELVEGLVDAYNGECKHVGTLDCEDRYPRR